MTVGHVQACTGRHRQAAGVQRTAGSRAGSRVLCQHTAGVRPRERQPCLALAHADYDLESQSFKAPAQTAASRPLGSHPPQTNDPLSATNPPVSRWAGPAGRRTASCTALRCLDVHDPAQSRSNSESATVLQQGLQHRHRCYAQEAWSQRHKKFESPKTAPPHHTHTHIKHTTHTCALSST